MTKPTENIESLEFPINEKLLEEAAILKNERDMIRTRIEKIDEKKDEVSPTVYQKVRNEYANRFKEATDALLEKKVDVDRELSALYDTRNNITAQLESHKQVLEEAKFRHTLGEFDDKQFKEASEQAEEKTKKFEKILGAVNNNIKRYEAIFPQDEGLFEEDMPMGFSSTMETGKGTSPSISTTGKEEDEYLVGADREDYFSAGSEKTDRSPVKSGSSAKVTILEGENAGKSFAAVDNLSFGRADSNAIVLKEAKVSRQHAIIKQKGAEFIIIDLNSSNGVFVNGHRAKEHVLSDGDEIEIGDFKMRFSV